MKRRQSPNRRRLQAPPAGTQVPVLEILVGTGRPTLEVTSIAHQTFAIAPVTAPLTLTISTMAFVKVVPERNHWFIKNYFCVQSKVSYWRSRGFTRKALSLVFLHLGLKVGKRRVEGIRDMHSKELENIPWFKKT